MKLQKWIYVFALTLLEVVTELNTQKVKTSCPVSGIQLVCSASNSLKFKWTLKSKWIGSCKNQVLKIKYSIPGLNINYYTRYTQVDVLAKQILIKGLEKNEDYQFNFVHYMNLNGYSNQVQNGFKMKMATPHEVGIVNNLTVVNKQPTSATVSWSWPEKETECVSHYILYWCWLHNNYQECQHNVVASTMQHHTLLNLTSCTLYSLIVTAVDIDQVVSSDSANLTFRTASEVAGTVRDVRVRSVTPHDISVSWSGQSCNPYVVSISELHGYVISISHHSVSTFDTSYTFGNLQPCTHYQVFVSTSKEEEDVTGTTQEVKAFTSIDSNATVTGLRVSQVTDHSFLVSWQPPTESLACSSGYKVQVSSSNEEVIQTRNTTMRSLVIIDLEPCTSYKVAVTLVFSGETLSKESLSVDVRTNTPAGILSQRVANISVTKQTADLIVFNWTQPHGAECLLTYRVFLYDSEYKELYNSYSMPDDLRTMFEFSNLQQCTLYYVYVRADFGNLLNSDRTQFDRNDLIKTFTTTTDNVVLGNLSIENSWSSLQVRWSVPSKYEVCTRHYEVRVCTRQECREPVTLNTTSYLLEHLATCTSYTVEVRAEHSSATSSITGVTRGPNAFLFHQPKVTSKTSDSITLGWAVTENFRNCEGRFILSVRDKLGSTAKNISLDHSIRQYKVENLKPCHSYYFILKLTDFDGNPTIDYSRLESFTKAAEDQKIKNLEVIPSHKGMIVKWSIPPESFPCVTHYQVSLKSQDGSLAVHNTTSTAFSWPGDPCQWKSVTVQLASGQELAGQPVDTLVRKQFEDLSKISVDVIHVGTREAKVQLISEGFVCVSDYTVSWFRVTNRSSADVANLTSVANQAVTLRQLEPCSTYSLQVTPRNGDGVIGVVSTTITTLYAEPELVTSIKTLSRGFNISWRHSRPDTRYCFSHVQVNVESLKYKKKVKVFADSYVIGDLIPCKSYLITLKGFGRNSESGKNLYSKWNDVSPEVLPVPDKVTLVNVTKDSATLDWDVGTTDNNSCDPRDLKANCRPSTGLNVYSAGWSPSRLHLRRLQPYTQYDCELFVINVAGASKRTNFTFLTLEGVPSQPRNVVVSARLGSEVSVSWQPPAHVPGVLKSYKVLVYNQSLLYPNPTCSMPTLGPRQLMVGGNVTKVVLEELSPATTLWVVVNASTAAGYGPWSEPVSAATLDGASSAVQEVKVSVSRSKVMLSWQRPCLTNGPISQFSVKLNGTRLNHDTASYTTSVTAQQPLVGSYSIAFNVSLLTAEAIYTVAVIPVGLRGLLGQNSTNDFFVPSRIPSPPSDQVFAELPLVRTTRSTATISLRSDLFPDVEGTIRYYAIIVARNFTNEPLSGWIRNYSWPLMKTWAAATQSHPTAAYQATQPWWDPFKDMDTSPFAIKQFTLGSEECSKSDLTTFCNGPLQSGNFYSVRIRAFTFSGFRDSKSIVFQTVDPVVDAYLIILGLVVLAVVTTIAFVYLVVKAHVKWNKDKKKHVDDNDNMFKNKEKKTPIVCERLPLVYFIDHVENIVTSYSLLEGEYTKVEGLTIQISGTANVARLPHNVVKNRYKNIVPYDSNAVKLEGDEANSYINASHIKFQGRKSRSYIACQGPKGETCEDFWKMIVQYKVNIIVMLCLLVENDRIKCFPYFPIKSNGVVDVGGFKIYCTREDIFNNYIVRHLTINTEGDSKQVLHFHFIQWNDQKAPEKPEMLVDFIDAIRRTDKHKQNPMVVHCSAGVGRTGTFIVVDELLRKVRHSWRCKLSIPDTLLRLRQQRNHLMVQTQEQYAYIYACLKYALEHHTSFIERVRNSSVKRSKVDLGAKEVIQMGTTPQTRTRVTASENQPQDCQL